MILQESGKGRLNLEMAETKEMVKDCAVLCVNRNLLGLTSGVCWFFEAAESQISYL